MGDNEGDECKNRNKVSDLFKIGNKWGAIPSNLSINLVAWGCLIVRLGMIIKIFLLNFIELPGFVLDYS